MYDTVMVCNHSILVSILERERNQRNKDKRATDKSREEEDPVICPNLLGRITASSTDRTNESDSRDNRTWLGIHSEEEAKKKKKRKPATNHAGDSGMSKEREK